MSTYDMYFSKKNKNYMFQTLSNLILQETGYDIKDDSTYIELYRLHYPSIFPERYITLKIEIRFRKIRKYTLFYATSYTDTNYNFNTFV